MEREIRLAARGRATARAKRSCAGEHAVRGARRAAWGRPREEVPTDVSCDGDPAEARRPTTSEAAQATPTTSSTRAGSITAGVPAAPPEQGAEDAVRLYLAHRPGPPADPRGRGAPGPARRAERHGGQERDDRGQPAPGGLDRQALLRPRSDPAGPDPGGQHGPDPRGREVRLAPRLQVLHLRHLVDPPGDHPRAGRPVAHDPHPGPHGRAHEPRGPRRAVAEPEARPRAHAGGDRRARGDAGARRSSRSSSSARSRSPWRRPWAARRATPASATSSRTTPATARTSSVAKAIRDADLERVLDALPWRERRVLELRYGLADEGPLTLEDIGQRGRRDPRARPPDRGRRRWRC